MDGTDPGSIRQAFRFATVALETLEAASRVFSLVPGFADATVYLLLFLSLSGVYLWTMLRAERRVGVILLSAGAVSFFGIVYALCN